MGERGKERGILRGVNWVNDLRLRARAQDALELLGCGSPTSLLLYAYFEGRERVIFHVQITIAAN